MNTAQLQLQFPEPGNWDKFTLTAIYQDADGYTHTDRYTQDDIPANQAPALAAAVGTITNMGEDWQACQVQAVLTKALHFPDDSEEHAVVKEGILLTIEASNDGGGRKIFTYSDYSEFLVYDPAAVAFFKYFTTNNK